MRKGCKQVAGFSSNANGGHSAHHNKERNKKMSIWGTMDEVGRETFMCDAVTLEKCADRIKIENDGFGEYRDSDGNRWNDNGDGTWSQSLFP
jgi:hypothetical protein